MSGSKQTIKTGIGRDSHRFLPQDASKPLVIGGLIFENEPGLQSNSDGDVIFHALCNAISSLTGIPILGGIADDLCFKDGITDSEIYLEHALDTLQNQQITHVAISLEGKRPKFKDRILEMRDNIARVMNLEISQVGITATSGEGLTDFGCGDGVLCIAIVTAVSMDNYKQSYASD